MSDGPFRTRDMPEKNVSSADFTAPNDRLEMFLIGLFRLDLIVRGLNCLRQAFKLI